MKQHLGLVSLVVRDHDEALEVFLFLHTDDVRRDVLEDLCGNMWDLLGPRSRRMCRCCPCSG